MRIFVAANGQLSLEEPDNFKSFSIIEAHEGLAAAKLTGIGTATDDGHFWLDADRVIALSPLKENPKWVSNFWEMLESVEKYGYADLEKRLVKAHVEADA